MLLWWNRWWNSEMPKIAKALTALHLRSGKGVDGRNLAQPGMHAVGTVAGLYLSVKSSGARSWVLRTMIGARRAELGLGGYPTVTLQDAHAAARKALQDVKAGIDPAASRRAARKTVEWTFRKTAGAYIEAHRAGWRNAARLRCRRAGGWQDRTGWFPSHRRRVEEDGR